MIDREKVVNDLQDAVNDDWLWRHADYYALTMERAIALLKEKEWHMLTEDNDGIIHGLPGDDGQYLMTDGKNIWIDDYVDGVADGISLDSGRDIREITAWMYMPKLPILD